MKTYVCKTCGHISFDEAPVECPVCRVAIENFENDPDALKSPVNSDNLTELEKKHTPIITIDNACSASLGGTCMDVHVTVGEIQHVMESEHFIDFIDVYVDKRYISRVVFTAKKMYPSVHLCLNTNAGMISVIAHCNVHGNWRSKIKIKEG
jgi:desulfoferrodoxin-like iron-binding protein